MHLYHAVRNAIATMNQPHYGEPDTALDNYFEGKLMLENALREEDANRFHLYAECKEMVDEAIEEAQRDHTDIDDIRNAAQDYLHQDCDSHEAVIYYGKAIQFCAEQDTDEGEQWLEDCGGIAQEGDTFGAIACRIAFATLLCECERILAETLEELEEES